MATLIQSKQIEGVVTASVIEGTFTVSSGSVDLGGATGVTGSFSGSFIGDGSQLTFGGTGLVSASEQINYNLLQNKPVFIAGSNITIASSSNNITITSTDGVTSYTDLTNIPNGIVSESSQVVALLPNNVFSGSFIGGSNVTITSGSGNVTISTTGTPTPSGTISSSAQITALGFVSESGENIPAGTVSSSAQITALGFVSESGTDAQTLSLNQVNNILAISNGNSVDLTPVVGGESRISGSIWSTGSDYYYVSADLQVTGGLSATSLTGSIDYSNLTNVPALVSSSVQIISLLPDGVVSGSSQVTDGSGILSGSIIDQLPSGVVSGSSQVTDGSGIFSSSAQLPDGLVSGSSQITDGSEIVSSSAQVITFLPDGTVSGSSQITDGSDIVSSSQQVVDLLPDGVISGSGQLPAGIVSSSAQVTTLLPDGVVSGSSQITDGSGIFSGSIIAGSNITVTSGSGNITIGSSGESTPAGTISGSAQITSLGFISESAAGTISSSAQVVSSLPSGTVSGSSQITDGSGIFSGSLVAGTNITINQSGNNFEISSSGESTPAGTISSSEQVISSLPDGVISGSSQLPSGLVSESAQTLVHLEGTNIFSGSLIPGANVTITSGSGNITITAANDGTSDYNNLINVPSGIVSSSSQLTSSYDSRYLNTNGDDVVSGSVLRNLDGTNVVSESAQVISLLPDGVISGSEQLPSGLVSESSQVVFGDVSSIPSGLVSGSSQVLNGSGVVSGSVIRTLDGTGVVSGSVLRTLDGTNVFSGSFIGGSNVTITSGSGNVTISSTGAPTPEGTISSSQQVIDSLPSGVISGSEQLPSGLVSESSQIVFGDISSIPSGLVSESSQVVFEDISSIPSGLVSESSQVVFGDISSIPSGLVSGSEQITDGSDIVSSSAQVTTLLPNGVISGSSQVTDGSDIVSSSAQVTSLLPDGVVSGSSQVLNGSGVVSGSVLRTLDGTGVVSGSVLRTLDGTGVFSGSEQLPDGIISGSSQIVYRYTLGSSGINHYTFTGNGLTGAENDPEIFLYRGFKYEFVNSSGGHPFQLQTTENGALGSPYQDGVSGAGGDYIASDGETLTINVQFDAPDTLYYQCTSHNNMGGKINIINVGGSGGVSDPGIVSSSQQVVDLLPDGVISGSILPGEGITVNSGSGDFVISASFDGNRTVSNTNLPSGIYNNNFGTSGSIQNFIEAVFFPNTSPSISTGNKTILEFSGSGAEILTLEATDAEGQDLTFGTASSYTDDLVRVATDGTMTLNAQATSASFNTDLIGGVHGHLVTVTAEDTFDAVTEKDIYIIVTPNEAPKFRETSVSGNVITSVTANLNENSVNNTLVKRVFFTDAEGDTITITTSSIDNEHFDVAIYSNYLDIRQNTGSLDYEQQTSYTFSITASDEHYPSDDSDSITFLPVTINVTDNLSPTVSNQVVGSINENSSNGTVVGTVSVSDSEGDSVSAPFFQLHKLYLDGSEVATGSYGGTSQASDPHENPFEIDSGTRRITRKNSVYLNSDLVNRYDYRVKVKDNFNAQISSASVVTININDDVAATLTDNWSAGPYIKESELDGANIRTTDYGSTQADYNSNQSGTWASSNSAISINSNGNLSLNVDLSGSLTSSGDTIDSTITFTNTFGTTTTDALSVSVVANDAPTISFTNQTGNFNTNLATEDTTMVSMSVSDTESDTPFSASLTGTDASSLKLKYVGANSASIGIQAASDLSAATYNYNVKITDNFGKSRDYNGRSFTVASADNGTLGGDTTSYIIESAESGAVIRDASGFNAGNQSQMTVSYSPNYGSQVVQGSSWASSNSAIAINTSGQLSLALDISGSDTGSGDDIVSTISFQDQYGNSGTGTVTVNVFANQAPTATFTNQTANFETDLATTGTTMVSMSVSDTESDTPFSASLTGTDASSLQLKYTNSSSSSVGIQASTNLSAATYNYNVKVTDNFGKSTTYSGRSFTIVQSADYGKTYVYRSDYGSDAGLSSNYNAVMGAQTVSGDTPPEVTAYTANNTSPYRLISSSLGDASLSLAGGKTATRVAILSGSDLDTIISESNPFTMGNTAEQYLIIAPSGSDMIGIPTSMTDGFGDNTKGRYVMAIKADGGSWGQEASTVHLLDTSGSINGYDKHFVIGRNGHNSAASVEIRIIEASGSLPS